MVGQTTQCPMGISNYILHTYKGDTFIILVEVGLTSYQISHHDEERIEEGMHL